MAGWWLKCLFTYVWEPVCPGYSGSRWIVAVVISQKNGAQTLDSDGFLQYPKLSNAERTSVTSALLFQIQWTKLKTHPICLVMFPLLSIRSFPHSFWSLQSKKNSAKGNHEVHAQIFILPKSSRPLAHRGSGVLRIVLLCHKRPPTRPAFHCRMELDWALSEVQGNSVPAFCWFTPPPHGDSNYPKVMRPLTCKTWENQETAEMGLFLP